MNAKTEAGADLAFALEVCQEAGQVAMGHFRRGVEMTMKPDNTPVTRADKECEALIRKLLSERFPDDALLGEEEEARAASGGSTRKWIIDPIDGTYNFARGIPIFSVLLALEVDGEIVVGVVHNPATEGETYYAERGGGAFRNGNRLKVSGVEKLEDSQFLFGAPNRILECGLWDGFTSLIKNTYRQRGLGDYLNFAYVFEGKAEAMIETGLKPWDIAPMKVIAEEAGGRFSDLEDGNSVYLGNCLVSNGKVHDAYLKMLKMP
jgi:histidinol-phosphatase